MSISTLESRIELLEEQVSEILKQTGTIIIKPKLSVFDELMEYIKSIKSIITQKKDFIQTSDREELEQLILAYKTEVEKKND